MLYVVPFEAEHLARMQVQAAQAWLSGTVSMRDLKGLEGRHASTLMQDGRPLVCAGAVEYWPGRALVWSFLSEKADRRLFVQVHAEAKRFLDGLPFRRLEAAVDVGFEAGHRWMRALGFQVEAPLQRCFQPNGGDSVGYVRIKEY